MQGAERSKRARLRRELKAMVEGLVRQRLIYQLVSEEKDDRVVRGSELAEWWRAKRLWERRHRLVADRKRQRACVCRKDCVEKG